MNKPVPIADEPCQQNRQVVKLVLQRIFGELPRLGRRLAHGSLHSARSVLDVLFVGPDRPEIHDEGSVDNVVDHRDGQHDAGDPVIRDPGKLHAHFRKEGGKKQREHREGHHSVESARSQRMPVDVFRKRGHRHRNLLHSHALKKTWPSSRRRARGRSETKEPPPRTPTKAPRQCGSALEHPTDFAPTVSSPRCLLHGHSANGALHQVPHQRDLVAVVLQRSRATNRKLRSHRGRLFRAWLPLHSGLG